MERNINSFREKNFIKKIEVYEKKIEKIIQASLILLISTIFTITFIQVINRYIFRQSIIWIEEISVYLFIWMIFLGMSLGIKKSEHFRMTEILMRLHLKLQFLVHWITSLFILFFLIVMIISSIGLIQNTMGVVALASGIPRFYFYISITIGAFFGIIFILTKIFKRELKNI